MYLFFRDVRMVVGDGAYAMVYPTTKRKTEKIIKQLSKVLKGVDIYRRDEIPEHLHWGDSKYCPPILVLAHPGKSRQKLPPVLK